MQCDADALRGERGSGEISVGGFTVGFQAYVSLRCEEIADIKVSDEVGTVGGAFSIAKVTVDEQAVVQQSSLQESVHLHVAPSHRSRGEVGAKGPVGLRAEHFGDGVVELSGECRGKERAHGCSGLSAPRVLTSVLDAARVGGVEASDAEEIECLSVHVLLCGNEAEHHLLFVLRDAGEVEVKTDLRCFDLPADVEHGVHFDVLVAESGAVVQITEARTVHGVVCLQIQTSFVRDSGERKCASGLQSQVFANDVLYAELVGSSDDVIGAIHLKSTSVAEVHANRALAVGSDGIAGARVGDDFELRRGIGIDEEIQHDFRSGRGGVPGNECDGSLGKHGGFQFLLGIVEAEDIGIFPHLVGVGQRIDERSGRFGAEVDVGLQISRKTLDVNISASDSPALERHFVIFLSVVAKEAVGFDAEVIAQVLEVGVSQCSCDFALTATSVVHGEALKEEGAGFHFQFSVFELIGHPRHGNACCDIGCHLPAKVKTFESAIEFHIARGVSSEILKNTIDIAAEETQVGLFRLHVQRERFLLDAHITVQFSALTSVLRESHVGIQEESSRRIVPTTVDAGTSHVAVIKQEVGH